MFSVGKSFKVKVEASPGQAGFGRATVVDRTGHQLIVQLTTSKGAKEVLPKGAKIWFVDDSPDNTFNGLWTSCVTGVQIYGGQTMMVCANPKLVPLMQKQRTQRVSIDVPVEVKDSNGSDTGIPFRSNNISRSGIAIETSSSVPDSLDVGEYVGLRIRTKFGEIALTSRIIRIERNWFANKTILGLEFADVAPETQEMLDKVLVSLGGTPRHPEAGQKQSQQPQRSSVGLSSWVTGIKSDTSLVRPAGSENSDSSQPTSTSVEETLPHERHTKETEDS